MVMEPLKPDTRLARPGATAGLRALVAAPNLRAGLTQSLQATRIAAAIACMGVPSLALAQMAPPALPSIGLAGSGLRAPGNTPLSVGDTLFTTGVRGNILLSNNLDFRPNGSDTGHGLLEVAPYASLRALTTRGPVEASGALRGQFRDGNTDSFRVRGQFSGSTDLRLIDDWMHVQARASVQAVNLDPFRSSSVDPGAQTANTGTLKDFEISPYATGQLSGDGSWRIAYRLRSIDLGNATSLTSLYAGSNVQQSVQAGLRTDLSRRALGLSVDSRSSWTDYRNGLDYKSAEADLLGWFKVSENLRLAAGWGWSYNERLLNSLGQDQGGGAVAALEWTPTPRTSVAARWADRYYGSQVTANAGHRFGPWTFGLAYGRGVQDGNLSNLYSLLRQQLISAQAGTTSAGTGSGVVAGLESSPAAVAAATLNPALQFAGLLPSPLVYFEQASASVRIQGARTAIQGALFFNDRRSAVDLGGLGLSDLNQRGASLAGSYRLDGVQTLNLGLRYTLTDSDFNASEARLWTMIGSWDVRLRPRWTGSVGARLQKQTGSGVTVQYDEAAVFVATDYRFQ